MKRHPMTQSSDKPIDKIKYFLDLAFTEPSKNPLKYFSFENDINKRFILNGEKLKCIHNDYMDLYLRDEFWCRIDVDKKEALYYAWDVEDYRTGVHLNIAEGHFDWAKIESSLMQFFVVNITMMTSNQYPY